MWVLKIVRKLFRGLSGAESPTQIALGFALGITLGLVPFTSGIGLLLFLCILCFRVSFPFAVVGWAVAGALRVAVLGSVLVGVGHWVLEVLPLQGLWSVLLNLPGIALLGLTRYAVMGGMVIGVLAGAALFVPIRFLVLRYRKVVVERLSQSKAFKYLTNLWLIRVLRWTLIG
jgi:uncharacterized protein (TIGR03546 family)